MIAISALFLAILLPLCSLAPGFLLVRRLRWTPLEKLCSAIALSLIFLYLAGTALFLMRLPLGNYYLLSAASLACAIICLRDLRQLWSHHQIRRALFAYCFLFVWCLLFICLIRHSSGGGWVGDWFEHYERALYFLHERPIDHIFLHIYVLPARPPMMNVISAVFLAQAGDSYEVLQLTYLFLSLLVFFPCLLIAGRLIPSGGRRIALITAILSLSPMFLQNVTFTWTKLLSAFYVILAIALYLRARHRPTDPTRIIAAFLCLAAGCLVHYSAGPFAIFILIHYLLTCLPRPCKLLEISASGLLCLALLASWFSWSVAYYGQNVTFASNTSVGESEKFTAAENITKVATNVFATLVPHPLHVPRSTFDKDFDQPRTLGYWRDYFFLIYQSNFTGALGSAGFIGLLYLLVRPSHKPPAQNSDRRFWLLFIPFTLLAGVATHGTPDPYGVAHVTLQPLILIGLVTLAAGLPQLPRSLRLLIILFCTADFVLGALLQFHLEQDLYQSQFIAGAARALRLDMLSRHSVLNSITRETLNYLGDRLLLIAPAVRLLILLLTLPILYILTSPDSRRPTTRRRRPTLSFYAAAVVLFAGVGLIAADILHHPLEDPDRSAADLQPPIRSDTDLAAAVHSQVQQIKAAPDSAPAHASLAYAFYRYDRFEYAFGQWVEALLLNPADDIVVYHVHLLMQIDNREMSEIPDLAAVLAVRRNPSDPAPHAIIANALLHRGHLDPAIAQATRSLKLNPAHTLARQVLHDALAFKGLPPDQIDRELSRFPAATAPADLKSAP